MLLDTVKFPIQFHKGINIKKKQLLLKEYIKKITFQIFKLYFKQLYFSKINIYYFILGNLKSYFKKKLNKAKFQN